MENTVRFELAENGICEMIHNKSGTKALIDVCTVEPLTAWMRENGSLYYDGSCFRQTGGRRYSAIKIIAALRNGKTVEQMELHNIFPKNGNSCDLRAENISFVNRWEIADHPDCTTVYDSEFNAIYDYGINVWLLLKDDGVAVQLDARNIIRNMLIRLIKNGCRIRKSAGQRHVVVADLWGNRRRLTDYILAEFYQTPLSLVENGTITYWNGNPLDLTINNIASTSVAMRENRNRSLFTQGNRVFVHLNTGLPHYTDNTATMCAVLEMPIWTWHTKADGRIAAAVSTIGKRVGVEEPYLYQLRWAVEHYGATDDFFSIAKALRAMKNDFGKDDSVLDHLDNNFRNCRLWNLARMKRSENAQKESITAKIFAPFFWISVFVDGRFLIQCGDNPLRPHALCCATSRDYVALLRKFYETGLDTSGAPKEIGTGQRYGYDDTGNLDSAGEHMVKHLLEAATRDFLPWSIEREE